LQLEIAARDQLGVREAACDLTVRGAVDLFADAEELVAWHKPTDQGLTHTETRCRRHGVKT